MGAENFAAVIFWAVIAVFAIVILTGTLFTVEQQSRAIIERFGRYVRTASPGLNVKIPLIDSIAQRVSLRVQQIPVEVETKTLDNLFVKLFVAVQYRAVEGTEAESYYKVQNHVDQIRSYVLDVVRAKVPKMNLDEVFEKKDDVGTSIAPALLDPRIVPDPDRACDLAAHVPACRRLVNFFCPCFLPRGYAARAGWLDIADF